MIGVAISTKNRYEVFKHSYEQLLKYMPEDAVFIVVDDGSDIPVPEANFRHNKSLGIARTKNRCLALLEEYGVTDFFLVDDDCFPISPDWWKPYVKSKEPHLMYQFSLPKKPLKELYRDNKIVAYDKTRGAFIYVNKIVLETVGGMDTAYGPAGFEHPDWTNRIYNAGLTTHRAMDVVGSDKLLYCLDQDGKVKSTIKGIKGNSILYNKNKTSKAFKRYK